MGGICGYISNKNSEQRTLLNMEETIISRGKYTKQFNEKNIGIANLNHKNDDCKFLNTDELIISIDGEVDNKEKGCKDVETIEKLYIKYGEKFVSKIEGYFSIAIYDKKENKLILVRDKIGAKPLYYYIEKDTICFASELKAIIKYPEFEKKINYRALSLYFRYSYINPPNTIFENTYKLEHGHYIIWKNGEIQDKIYWDGIEKFNELSKNPIKNFEEAKENLKDIIKQYLTKTIQYNDNVGIYLSGGIDSTLVSSICSNISKKTINTFSIGFYEEERNEAENAKKNAEYLKTNHHEIYIDKAQLLSTIKKIPKYYDEPFSDGSQLPTIILNEFAKENGIKTAITGDGADQLFCGSKIYDTVRRRQRNYRILNPFNISINTNLVRETDLRYLYNNTDKKNQTQVDILAKEFVLEGLFKDIGDKRYNFEDKIDSKSWQVRRMVVDINTFLANRINTKTDRTNSNNGIEIKSPFLENKLIEYSFRIPQNFKYYKKEKKYILKQILYDYVPKDLLDTKKKGFGIPVKKWLITYLYEDLMKVASKDFIEKQEIFNYDVLNRLIKELKNEGRFIKNVQQILWDFYMFQLWYINYI